MLYHDIRDIDYREFDNIITVDYEKNPTCSCYWLFIYFA